MYEQYDENYAICFSYPRGTQPAIEILVTNPLNNKSILLDNAVVDSGADCTSAPSFIGEEHLLHNLQKIKKGTYIYPHQGIGGSDNELDGYLHSGIIQLYRNNIPIDFLKPLNIDISFLKSKSGHSPNFPFLLGRRDFFLNFYIAFYNTPRTSNMLLIPRRNIILY